MLYRKFLPYFLPSRPVLRLCWMVCVVRNLSSKSFVHYFEVSALFRPTWNQCLHLSYYQVDSLKEISWARWLNMLEVYSFIVYMRTIRRLEKQKDLLCCKYTLLFNVFWGCMSSFYQYKNHESRSDSKTGPSTLICQDSTWRETSHRVSDLC